MLVDFKSLVLAPAYLVYGVDAVLTLNDTAGTEVPVTVIDKTDGLELGDNVEVGTIVPGAYIQFSDLTENGLTTDDLNGAQITFNGNTWSIASHYTRPVPSGETDGEIVLVLEEDNG